MKRFQKTRKQGYSRTKYGNRKVGEFDSAKEANRYSELRLMEKAGKIANLEHHVSFELIPAQYETIPQFSSKYPNRELKPKRILLEKSCSYEADFVYTDLLTMETVVEDSKGISY